MPSPMTSAAAWLAAVGSAALSRVRGGRRPGRRGGGPGWASAACCRTHVTDFCPRAVAGYCHLVGAVTAPEFFGTRYARGGVRGDVVVLSSRLHPPAGRPDAVARRDLLARLNESVSAKLVVVAAPAGWGKTSLLRNWCSAGDAIRTRLVVRRSGRQRPSAFLGARCLGDLHRATRGGRGSSASTHRSRPQRRGGRADAARPGWRGRLRHWREG